MEEQYSYNWECHSFSQIHSELGKETELGSFSRLSFGKDPFKQSSFKEGALYSPCLGNKSDVYPKFLTQKIPSSKFGNQSKSSMRHFVKNFQSTNFPFAGRHSEIKLSSINPNTNLNHQTPKRFPNSKQFCLHWDLDPGSISPRRCYA